jgi:signal transduction histidine kinase
MNRTRPIWIAFAAAVAVVLASMGWVTAAVLRLDRRAQLEENARLALWRMDSAIAPLIAEEQARPARGFISEDGATPAIAFLLGREIPFISRRFESDAEGTVTDPLGKNPGGGPGINSLRPVLPRELIVATLPPDRDPPRLRGIGPDPPQQVALAEPTQQQQQLARNSQEYQARVQSNVQQMANRSGYTAQAAPPESDYQGVLRPVWHDGFLYLIRRTGSRGANSRIQGCLIEWPTVRKQLLDSCADLLPVADLQPVQAGTTDPEARLLASLPVRLIPGDLPPATGFAASPMRLSLTIAWACVLAATAAVGALLAGVSSLSNRRGAFVSAVTHELRTPLTTLRMYTEMLADGMVAEESQRRGYLQTLRAEADRLGHLVENVLAYSRLERNRAGYEVSEMTVVEATDRTIERLAERARQAGMTLRADVPPDVTAIRVRANALALEQILFNLVDNACKYAAGAADRTIAITASADDRSVCLRVRDHGPGIPAAGARQVFRPFGKSAQDAANSAPGLGLGLALSRRLARSMGGELRADHAVTDGASMVLMIRRA